MPRVPGTTKRSQWAIVPNPGYEGKTPRPLKAMCHDGTPFITIVCNDCGNTMHQHESTINQIPADAEVASACKSCHRVMVFPPGFFQAAFKQLRDEGWVAE